MLFDFPSMLTPLLLSLTEVNSASVVAAREAEKTMVSSASAVSTITDNGTRGRHYFLSLFLPLAVQMRDKNRGV